MHVAEAKQKIGSRFTWLCDTMTNDAKHALGDAPNSEFVIGPDGKVIQARRWSRPDELRADLEELVGEVENPTSIEDVGMKRLEAPKTAPKGIVARLQLPGGMTPIEVRPSTGLSLSPLAVAGDLPRAEPLYVKLRAEVDSQYFKVGEGKLYLGFFLDPLYEVHWNNQVAPVAYEINAPTGVEITPLKGNGPTVGEKADADPREFLVELSGESKDPIKLTVKYFACDDAETFCKPVTQHYLVTLQRDRDGGSRRGGGRSPSGFAGRPSGESTARSSSTGEDAVRRSRSLKAAVRILREHDANEDGKLNKSEWTRVKNAPVDSDADKDGVVSFRELIDAIEAQTTQSADSENSSASPARERGGRFAGPPRGFGRSGGGRRPNPAEMLVRMDANGDGKVSKSEVPAQMLQRWDRMDTNGDGVIDKKELQELAARFQRFSRDGAPGNRPDDRRSSGDQRAKRPTAE